MSACVHHDTTSRATGFIPAPAPGQVAPIPVQTAPVQAAPIPQPDQPRVTYPSNNSPVVGRPIGRPVNELFNIWG